MKFYEDGWPTTRYFLNNHRDVNYVIKEFNNYAKEKLCLLKKVSEFKLICGIKENEICRHLSLADLEIGVLICAGSLVLTCFPFVWCSMVSLVFMVLVVVTTSTHNFLEVRFHWANWDSSWMYCHFSFKLVFTSECALNYPCSSSFITFDIEGRAIDKELHTHLWYERPGVVYLIMTQTIEIKMERAA